MASYTYLTSSASSGLSEEHSAAPEDTPCFEGKHGIPLFWLCLFDTRHIKELQDSQERNGHTVAIAYPYLQASREEALILGHKRRAMLESLFTADQLALFDSFLNRVEQEFAPYVTVITDDVADMGEPGEYAVHIREALKTMTGQPAGAWLSNFSFENVSALDRPFAEASASALMGYDNASARPEEAEETPEYETAARSGQDAPLAGEDRPEEIPAPEPTGRKKKKEQDSEQLLDALARELIPQRFHVPMDGVRTQELLYTIQVALAVQKANPTASSPKGRAAARKFLNLAAKRSHISHGGSNKLLAFDRTPKAKLWGYTNMGVAVFSLCCIGLAFWLHWLWALGLLAGLAFWLFFPDPTITAFEFSKGHIRRGFKRVPFSEITLAHFTLTGKDEHLWASLNLFASPLHVIVLSGPGREKYMLAFFCALWRLMFPVK